MKKILYLNPAISSLNIGDKIIEDGCKTYLNDIFPNDFIVEFSTHLPLNNFYFNFLGNIDYKFVLGSNLLSPKLNQRFRQWDINILNVNELKPLILMGVGWQQYSKKITLYTKYIYKKILSNQYVHSVRDEYTKEILNKIGINNVLNTGCPTMWKFTPEFCKKIPCKKGKDVVFTLTDYNKNEVLDANLIDVLKKNYNEVYFWPQGIGDYEYFKNTFADNSIKVINCNLEDYDKLLKEKNDLDFVGTRLHGGIRAMQFLHRSIIIAIDNRAKEIHRDYNIPIIERINISNLEKIINSEFETKINIPIDNINKWLSQFKEIKSNE